MIIDRHVVCSQMLYLFVFTCIFFRSKWNQKSVGQTDFPA
ncbi:hypothetical protein CES85_2615 [Ochrobactrum quorumnocens]|uniref:Uncharacterized protein n=1 Tax=Ochrobactrum quorumnocens TaxID=271865 RepID=A0A248UKF6_9HYPH|nr:hypothetical protein CES85_2615 [[Ochrobactrum] quorumnocens]